MKAKIVQQKVCESALDWNHGGGFIIKRLVIEEKDNLAITLHKNKVLVFTGFNLGGNCKIIGEVEVPPILIEKALALVQAEAEANGLKDLFETLVTE